MNAIRINFNLKDAKAETSLLIMVMRWDNNTVKVSTGKSVCVKAWDKDKKRCFTSGELFTSAINKQSKEVNKFLDELSDIVTNHFNLNNPNKNTDPFKTVTEDVKYTLQWLIQRVTNKEQEQAKKAEIQPLDYFADYVNKDRIDPHTKRYVSERTKAHQRTVLKRIISFFEDTKIPCTWNVFSTSRFEKEYTNWCFKTKNYKANTVNATFGVLKPWLNAAKKDGYDVGDDYALLQGKGQDVDAIYLTEDEIQRIYELDIPTLKATGYIDSKSEIETTRDLFIVGCWTGLRRSDLSRLNKLVWDFDENTVTATAEKTKKQVVLPIPKQLKEIYQKYNGKFPVLCDRGKCNKHLRQLGELAGIDTQTPITENRGGKVTTTVYKKYQLIGMHTARRSFATNMYKRGLPTIMIMQLTGHTTEENFLKYIKITKEENARMVMERLKDLF